MADEPVVSMDNAGGGQTVKVSVAAPPPEPAKTPPLQPITVLPPKASRRFSKWVVLANSTLAWGAIFASIFWAQAAFVALGGFAMVAVLGAQYMNIGHRDLRLLVGTLTPTSTSYFATPQYDGPPPEGEGE